ncbi:MAG: hypothetical protein WKG07_12485 [Hymenobacter sp.]
MSGPDPLRHQVLELAAVIEDTRRAATTPLAELPAFRRALAPPRNLRYGRGAGPQRGPAARTG